MKLAIDNQISLSVVEGLKRTHEVVMWSGDKQDEVWIEDALDLGAEVFISPDLDVPNYLDRINSDAHWIDVPQNLPRNKQLNFIISKLNGLRK